jgi:2'-5' RNA ligase
MRLTSLLISLVAGAVVEKDAILSLPGEILNTATVPFSPNTKPGFGSYLELKLNYTFVEPIFNQLKREMPNLASRGEAHITVITPPEYNKGLSSFLSIQEINQIALKNEIQSMPFELVCLARQSQFDPKLNRRAAVYNLIVKSPALFQLRSTIYEAYLAKGGDPSNFSPETFFPHVTVAFEERGDWFVDDQVYKTARTCIKPISLE